MNEPSLADRTFHIIMRRMVETGQAPHFTEIATDLGVSMEKGRLALHALIDIGLGGWLYPGTDLIVSMAPFHSLPNQYRITIDGQQKWFAQCAFESPAVCWLFPGKTIHLEAPCLDCGEPIRVDFKDGEVLNSDPEGLIGHVSVPLRKWQENVTFT